MRGEGSTVWDDAGNALIDISGALWYCNVGYGRPSSPTRPPRRCASSPRTRPTTASPRRRPRRWRRGSRSSCRSTAPRSSSPRAAASRSTPRRSSRARTGPRSASRTSTSIVSRQFAYHGSNAYGTSLGGMAALTDVYGRLVSDVEQVPWDDAEALAEAIDRARRRPGRRLLRRADHRRRRRADPARGLPRAASRRSAASARCCSSLDEVITGFGRTGEWFATGRYGLSPDLITVAKGITSGYIPLGGVIASARVAEPFWADGHDERLPPRLHVRRARDRLRGRAREPRRDRARGARPAGDASSSRCSRTRSRPLADHPAVAEVRTGVGLLGAVELADPSKLQAVIDAAYERGVLVRGIRGVALQVSPPFVITEDEIATTARRRRGAGRRRDRPRGTAYRVAEHAAPETPRCAGAARARRSAPAPAPRTPPTYRSTASSVCCTESVHSSSRPGVAKMPRFMFQSQPSSVSSTSWCALNVS